MKFRFGMNHLPTIAVILASGTIMNAQMTTGMMTGGVKDSNGNPLGGVTVIVSSSALMSPRMLTTDDRGEWRAPLLPPGSYKIVVSKSGLVGSSAEGVRVGVGTSVRQDLTMKPMVTTEATVDVVADGSAVVDKADTKVASNFSAETLATIPTTNRSFEGAADLTAGVVTGGNGQPVIAGGMSNSTLYRIDGVDIKNDLQGTRTGTGVMEDMIEDVQVVVSPLNGRYGRTTGGAVNVVKKSGGNEFTGSIRSTIDRPSWRANKHGLQPNINDTLTDDFTTHKWDVTFMGPILKDRLWFSLSTTLSPTGSTRKVTPNFGSDAIYNRAYVTGNATIDSITLAGPGSGYQFTRFDAMVPYYQKDDTKFLDGKLTFAVTQDHTIELSMGKETNTNNNRDQYSGGLYVQQSMLSDQTAKRTIFGLGYRGLVTSKALVEANYNFNTNEIKWPQHVDSTIQDPCYLTYGDINSGLVAAFTSPAAPNTTEIRGSRSGRINLTLYWDALGSHSSDMGYDQYTGRYRTTTKNGPNNRRFYLGGVYTNGSNYQFPSIVWPGNNVLNQMLSGGLYGLAPVMIQYYGADGETNTFNQGFYLTDAWTINNNWNVMFSIRADFFQVNDTDRTQLAKSNAITPRFQLKFDPLGDSRHVITFTAARYADDFTTGFTSSFIKTATAKSLRVGWTGAAIGQPPAGSTSDPNAGVRFITYADLVNMDNWKTAGSLNFFAMSAAAASIIDPGLTPPISNEVTLGYSRMLEGGSKVGVTLRYRNWQNQFALKQDYAMDQFMKMDDPTGSGKGVLVQTTQVTNSDDLKREYKALDIDFKSVLSRVWSIQGLFTYSRLKGNDQGGDSGTSSFRDNSVTPYFFQRRWMDAQGIPVNRYSPYGFLLNHQLFKARLSVVGTFPVGKGGTISYAWLASYDSGSRYAASDTYPLGLAAIANPDPTNILAMPAKPATRTEYYSSRGAFGINDFLQVDFKLSYSIPLGFKALRLIGDVAVNNLFNTVSQLDWNRDLIASGTGTTTLQVRNPDLYGTTTGVYNTTDQYFMNCRSISGSIGFKF